MTGMYANEAGLVCVGCDADGPRAYGNTLEAAKAKAAEKAEAAQWRRESENSQVWRCPGCAKRAEGGMGWRGSWERPLENWAGNLQAIGAAPD